MPREGDVSPRKPRGGYQLIPAALLAVAWWCYREKLIRLADLRVWFAAWEMRARRCRRPAPLPRRFAMDELRGLTGLSPRRLGESVRRLEAAGLLNWSESAIGFPVSPDDVPLPDRVAFGRFLDRIPNHRRLLPVPRRILRLLAGGARPALIATILGHLLRCLYLRQGKCSARGRVKASWIAETFGVGLRRVKEARRELIAMSWLIPLDAGQWELNRWGAHVRINLEWSRLDTIAGSPGLAPPAAGSGTESAPPESDRKPLRESRNQEPAPGGPDGVFNDDRDKQLSESAPSAQLVAVTGNPSLRHVVPEDLSDTGRLLDLYAQAIDRKLAGPSEWGRLRFVAAAEHARAIGTKNPCGLFSRLVRGGLWHFATQDDETAASVRIRRHLQGDGPRRMEAKPVRIEPTLSDDALLVRAVRESAARAGLKGDPFLLVRREQPEWTRDRWDRAAAELGGLGSLASQLA
jgi:hypothetical protein